MTEEAADVTPFGTLLHFKKDIDQAQPRVLLIAPLSGHFATLLRATVRTMLPEHDVYITDWHNARDVATEHGRFGFDDYIGHLIRFLETIGPGAHMVAVCQPCVAALVAAAVMAQGDNPAQPRSMTLMAGPIDTRVNPTKVNELAKSKPIEWFEKTSDRSGAAPLRRRRAQGLSRLRAARRLHEHEPRSPPQGASGALRESGEGRGGEGGADQGLLRRIFRRARSHRGVLSGDGAAGVPGARAAARRAHLREPQSRAAGDPPHHAVHGGRREGRHLRGRADFGGA